MIFILNFCGQIENSNGYFVVEKYVLKVSIEDLWCTNKLYHIHRFLIWIIDLENGEIWVEVFAEMQNVYEVEAICVQDSKPDTILDKTRHF